ncbi:MAG: hypothetical protein ACJ72N_20155 [Labedaea sp.]
MYLLVDLSGPVARVSLDDAGNMREFSVVVVGGGVPDGRVAGALAGLGTIDGEHAWLDGAAVKRLAGAGVGESWPAEFDRMTEFARSKGWTDAHGRLRAHLKSR